jgi:long-chain acyl-CoA synthetase
MLNETDVYPSYLPAAHSFEQALQATAIITGMQTGFYGGNPLALVSEDLPALKPTLFPSVPRIYNRIFGKIQDTFAAAQGCKASLIANAVSTKLANLRANGAVTHGCWDGVVFKKVKGLVGGKVRVMLTGSAPISGEVLDFMKICFCCPVIEGYGMTETSAGSFTTLMGDPVSGHVGGPQPNVKIRLKDIPEMGYSATNAEPTGECLFWGPSVMTGYFKNPEKTAEAFDGPPENGWLKSGDVVKVFPNGSIKIVDRAKNIFKLS